MEVGIYTWIPVCEFFLPQHKALPRGPKIEYETTNLEGKTGSPNSTLSHS